jgi:hypothetical protein
MVGVLHHGMCAVPTTDPAMNATSVISIRVLPPPAVYSVPDAQPLPIACRRRTEMRRRPPSATGAIDPQKKKARQASKSLTGP